MDRKHARNVRLEETVDAILKAAPFWMLPFLAVGFGLSLHTGVADVSIGIALVADVVLCGLCMLERELHAGYAKPKD